MDEVEILIAQLDNSDEGVMKKAAETLVKIGGAKVIQALLAIAEKGSNNEKLWLVIPSIAEMICDDDCCVRTIEAIAKNSPVGYESERAIRTLVERIGWQRGQLEDWEEKRRINVLVAIGRPAAPFLIKILKEHNWLRAKSALSVIERIGVSENEFLEIAGMLAGTDWDHKFVAVEAMAVIRDQKALPHLVAELNNANKRASGEENELVRKEIVKSIKSICKESAGVETFMGPYAAGVLAEALKGDDWEMRSWAAEIIVKIGAVAIPQLIEALKDGNASVRCTAAMALKNIAKANPGNAELLTAVFPLIDELNDGDSNARSWAAGALGKIGDIRAVQPLIERLDRIECAELVASEIIVRCKTTQHLEDFEIGLKKGYDNLKKSAKTSELLFRIQIKISRLMTEVAKKRDELAQDKGILLSDIPKPPKGGKGIYQATRVMRNG